MHDNLKQCTVWQASKLQKLGVPVPAPVPPAVYVIAKFRLVELLALLCRVCPPDFELRYSINRHGAHCGVRSVFGGTPPHYRDFVAYGLAHRNPAVSCASVLIWLLETNRALPF